jgi:addiction module RelB/DinJ family antitoxin
MLKFADWAKQLTHMPLFTWPFVTFASEKNSQGGIVNHLSRQSIISAGLNFMEVTMASVIQVRVHPCLKREVEDLCERMGLSLSVAVRLFINQIWLEKKIPFEIHIPRKFFSISCQGTNGTEYRPDLSLNVTDSLRKKENEEF